MIKKFQFRLFILISVVIVVNSSDIWFLALTKIGLPKNIIYIVIVPSMLMLITLTKNIARYTTYKRMVLLTVIFSYFLFQLINGFNNTTNNLFPIVTFISFFTVIFLIQEFNSLRKDELSFVLKKVTYYSLVLYLLTDIGSIVIMNDSQHVVLTNNLPFFILAIATIIMQSESKNKSFAAIGILVVFIGWIYISVNFFTVDQRWQVKGVVVSFMLILILSFLYIIRKWLPQFNTKFSLRIGIPVISLMAAVFVVTAVFFLIDHIQNNPSIIDRDTSIYLRTQVSMMMLETIFNADIINAFFGYGLGSSAQEYSIVYLNVEYELKSHSGLISLFYEHGYMTFPLIATVGIYSFFSNKVRIGVSRNYNQNSYKKNYRGYTFLVLLLLSLVWLSLNIVYLVAIPIPAFGHQTQLMLCILLVVNLKKEVFNCYEK